MRKNRHTEKEKTDLVKTYIMLQQNTTLAAKVCGIPLPTVNYWKKQKWWDEVEQKLLAEDKIVVSKRLSKMLDLAADIVVDRMERGDFFYDPKTGTVQRKPVALRDAHAVFKDAMELKRIQEKEPEEAKDRQTIKDTLTMLAKNFEELAAKQKEKPVVQVTDVMFIEEKEDAEDSKAAD